jgi:hypothetical protein
MRYVFRLGFALALGLALMAGCSDENGEGGSGGMAGSGGEAGTGGSGGMSECQGAGDGTPCDEGNECTVGTCASGVCDTEAVADGTACGDGAGTCQAGSCQVACTEQGIRDAVATGGGPYTFGCDGPQTVVTEAVIEIDNEVTLDGAGNLTVDGNDDHFVFTVPSGVTAELRGFGVRRAGCPPEEASDKQALPPGCKANGITNGGTLTVRDSMVSDNAAFGIYNGDGASLTVLNTTVSGNDEGGHGIDNDGLVLVINSTISGNDIFNDGSMTLLSSTLSNEDGEYALGSSTTTTIANTLVRGDCENNRPLTSNGYNIESPGNTCGFDQPTDQVEVTPERLNLGPLQDNGGPTMTHALLTEPTVSVAIDRIPAEDCVDADGQPLTADQRGEPRPETGGTMCDVGAFEVQP